MSTYQVPTMAEMVGKGESPEILFWVGCAGSFDDRVSYFSSSVSGKRWFTLFLGSYSDLESVQKALSVLPVRLDAMRVRRISSVVQDLCNGLDDVPVSVLEKLRSRCSEQM